MSKLTGSNVLVTGGSGFLGARVVERLIALGANVSAPSHSSFNLMDKYDVHQMINIYAPDIVIHLAADVGGIGDNQSRPADMFYNNAMMGLNVLNESAGQRIDKLVMMGTVCSYPANPPLPFSETDIWNGYPEETNAAYGIAKRMLLAGCIAYKEQYGLNSVYLLSTNMYGPNDNFDRNTSHVIPAIIRKVYEALEWEDEYVNLWGDGTATRDFIYVDEVARAVCLAAEKVNNVGPYNIGSGTEVSIDQLAHIIGDYMDYPGEFLFDHTMPNGQSRRVLETSLSYNDLGFEDSVPLEQGIQETVAWYMSNRREGRI
jgi:GDP-L-fucose synthase